MFKQIRPVFLISAGLAIAFSSAALNSPVHPWDQAMPTITSTLIIATATAVPSGNSELIPGRTDLILLLGMILVVIIVASIMWHRRDWGKE
jgi:hypothetical protein